jgi:hypothetical protein
MSLRTVSSRLSRTLPRQAASRVRELTGIDSEQWDRLATAFPMLPARPGLHAARARQRLHRLCARALRTGRWDARLEGDPPELTPAVYVTAHFGALRALRYTLRARGVAAAIAIGPHNLEREEGERQDRIFDARHALDFPHVFEAARVHRLRAALRRGSLLLAADLPASAAADEPLLGGRVSLDPRPLRLARAAGVPCRAAFLTLPEDGWTLTLGAALPEAEGPALEAFARLFARTAARAPWDLDGVVYRSLAGAGR